MDIICHTPVFVKVFSDFLLQIQHLFTIHTRRKKAWARPYCVLQYRRVMKMKKSRLFRIVYRLLEEERITAPALAQEMEVSVRTIHRDVEALCQAGIPLVTEQGRSGGIRLMEGFSLKSAMMDDNEQQQLLTAMKVLAAVEQDGDALLGKLAALFRKQRSDWLRVDLSHWGPVNADDERFSKVKTAVLEKHILQFSYAGYNGMSARRVKPILLYFKGSAWYLQAFCLTRNDFRTFKLNRVSAPVLTDEHFDDDLTPPPLEPWDQTQRWPQMQLRFAPALAYRVYDEYDEACICRNEDGSLLVTACLPFEEEWVQARILSYGTDAEVLSPACLRSALAARALKLHRHYQTNEKS